MIMLGGCTARGFSFYKTKHANHAVKQRRTHDQLRLMPFYGATASQIAKGDPKSEIAMRKSREPVKNE